MRVAGLEDRIARGFRRTYPGYRPEQTEIGGRERMNDAMQQRIVSILAAAIAYLITQYVVERLIDLPEERGVKDDAIEAFLKGATTATSTILASVLVRRLFRS